MKKNRTSIYLAIQLLLLYLLPTLIFSIAIFTFKNVIYQGLLISSYIIWLVVISIIAMINIKKYMQNNLLANNGVNYFIEKELFKSQIGVIVFLDKGKIVWTSNFIETRFSKNIIGKNIKELLNLDKWDNENLSLEVEIKGFKYEVHIILEKNLAIFKDVTIRDNIISDYTNQRVVFGEINIDNINLFQASMSEDELFKVYSIVINMLEDLTKKYDLIYRQYENGRYFIITNQETLDKLESEHFRVFESLGDGKTVNDNLITVSAGFAYGIYKLDTLSLLAKEALLQSQTRGGNQTTVMSRDAKSRHYGSTSEIKINISRTNVKLISQGLVTKLMSHDITRVIIYGHKNADLDAIGSAYGLYVLSKEYNKEAYIQNLTYDETTTRKVNNTFTSELRNNIFISARKATKLNDDNTLVILTDVADENRIENKNAFKNIKKNNIFVIDHHRILRNPTFLSSNNLYIDSSASSASEIVTEIIALTNNKNKINKTAAQFLLDGIYLDTSMFQKHTSSKTFYACSLLEEWGADAQKSTISLKMSEEIYDKVAQLKSNMQEIKPGYFLSYADIEASSDIIAIAAEEILRVEGRKAAFVVGKLEGTNRYKLSARGLDTNVQVIAEAVNGGGHFGAAAAESSEPLEVFVDNIKQAIVSVKNESNNN